MLLRSLSPFPLLLVCLVFARAALAAETLVPAGSGTLAQAIADAAPGDVLVLEQGNYLGDVLIDKSLTLRGTNAAAMIMVDGDSFVIDAPDAEVVIHGIDLGVTVNVDAAADVKILESQFSGEADIDVSDYQSVEGDGSLLIVGNRLRNGGVIATIRSIDAYIAGNILDKGHIHSEVPVWIVGNRVWGTANTDAINVNGAGSAQVIGNRVTVYLSSSYCYYCNTGAIGIRTDTATAMIAANLVELSYASAASDSSSWYREDIHGIYAPSSTFARVYNNTIASVYWAGYGNTSNDGIEAYGEIGGNIVTSLGNYTRAINGTGTDANLCYNNYNNACGDNAITDDPLFVDTTDYQLADDSPAIDAGPESPYLADRDGSRNDMGAHGGPWGIDQFDAQRDPLYLGPFIYPLFDANASLIDGQLQVRAIGVARLR